MKYFRLMDNINFPGRWYLTEIEGINNWNFMDKDFDVKTIKKVLDININRDGNPMDYTETSPYGVSVLTNKAKQEISNIEGLSFVELRQKVHNNMQLWGMVVHKRYYCVDEEKSKFEKWADTGDKKPNNEGIYQGFFKIMIDPSKTEDSDVFRMADWDVALIVSEKFKKRFEDAGITGTTFLPVTE